MTIKTPLVFRPIVVTYELYLLDPPPLALKIGDQLEHL